jgi:alcohol/geraniol dehydrogenase (NADP+)
MPIRAFAAKAAHSKLERFDYDPGPLGDEQVEIAVEYCGICHSDLSIMDNEWGVTQYPVVPGHEVVGKVAALGKNTKGLKVGQRVGLGWYSGSCMQCRQCLSGNHNLCLTGEATIVGHHGGFADRVRCQWLWATPIIEGIDPAKAGPMFCGGITVFNPITQFGIKPTDRVGVVGIGGLGHIALQFLRAWGCEVVAFTSSERKFDEAKQLGAHRAVSSRDDAAVATLKGTLDFLLITVNVAMNWGTYIDALAPKGRLHFVGAVLEPVPVAAMQLIMAQKEVSGSPLGSPATTAMMLEFAARHHIAPVIETFPMSKVNEALDHLREGKARYRIVLENDLR